MTKFILMVGLPGSGKSTLAQELAKSYSAKIHSSDDIREELGDVNDQTKNQVVFDIMQSRAIKDLKSDVNVIYDATNLSVKNRKKILALIPNSVFKTAIVTYAGVRECIKRQSQRGRKVPTEVILKMYRNFELPTEFEGFDLVELVNTGTIDLKETKERIENLREACYLLKHDNPYHTLTVGDHMDKAHNEYFKSGVYSTDVLTALYYHDIGKFFTKTFKNSKGEITDIAHFYGHENVSTYELMGVLFADKYLTVSSKHNEFEMLMLVQFHMILPDGHKNLQKKMPTEFLEKLAIMREYDRKGK